MYCIMTEENWARMAGTLSINVSRNWSYVVIGLPLRSWPNKMSFSFAMYGIPYYKNEIVFVEKISKFIDKSASGGRDGLSVLMD